MGGEKPDDLPIRRNEERSVTSREQEVQQSPSSSEDGGDEQGDEEALHGCGGRLHAMTGHRTPAYAPMPRSACSIKSISASYAAASGWVMSSQFFIGLPVIGAKGA